LKEKIIVPSITILWRELSTINQAASCADSLYTPALEVPFSSPVSDEQLAARLMGGDPEALSLVYDRFAASLFRVLCAWLDSTTDAEDALQEVFVRLATGRIGRIRDLRAYLFMAARNQAMTHLRQRRKEQGWEDITTLEIAAPEANTSSHDWPTLLYRLPLEQREVIVLKVWEQMTFNEIAVVVGASANTVMSRYRYGIERLRCWCREEEGDV
jgi:RNA polymerase sigma-70 factor (ECF subfamily)